MAETKAPLVSVIVPAYNAAPFIAEALESVLRQDYRPIEVIVVDDGSADATAEIARSFGPPVLVLGQAHAGIGAARNAAIAAAYGELLAFLDADDLWTPGKLSRQVSQLEADSSLDMVFGQAVEFRTADDGRIVERPPASGLLPGAALIRMDAFHRVGWFRTNLRVGEFIDWYARATESGLRSAIRSEPVLRRRIHKSNTGTIDKAACVDYISVVRAALERRRRTGSFKKD
jgi:glycosyltransferase involved in cell wall biosynthesis